MRINKIEINNFKLFSDREITFNPNFNLLIGTNGTGKTSLLRAIAVALGGWANAYIKNDKNLRPIYDNEIREIQIDNRFDKTKTASIKAYGDATIIDRFGKQKNGKAVWTRSREEGNSETILSGTIQYYRPYYRNYSDSYQLNLTSLGNDILQFIENKHNFNLPLIAFYECDRLWLAENELNLEASAKARYSRFDPYVDCFHTGADHQAIGEWLLKHEIDSLQEGAETPVLQSIRNAAITALENCTGFRYDFKQGRVIVEYNDGTATPFEHLSDGQRTILGLFCDIARRAAILNPHLGGDASQETEGIVLIDELDLHLHPKWQRRIIEDLRNIFPKIQFICTSHSPFLIQSLRSSEELIMLEGEPLADYSNKGIETIAKNMGVDRPDVSIRYEQMKEAAKTFLQILDEQKLEPQEIQKSFQQQLATLIEPYADNPAYQAFLELKHASKLGHNEAI